MGGLTGTNSQEQSDLFPFLNAILLKHVTYIQVAEHEQSREGPAPQRTVFVGHSFGSYIANLLGALFNACGSYCMHTPLTTLHTR